MLQLMNARSFSSRHGPIFRAAVANRTGRHKWCFQRRRHEDVASIDLRSQ